MEHREEMARLYSAMEALSPSQRELVEKVYFEERKITDIAAEENVSHVAIIRRLNRIYEKLRKKFVKQTVTFCLSRGLTVRAVKMNTLRKR